MNNRKAYIIGNGIAGMAAAAFLVKDGGLTGGNIFIFDQGAESGGSFDGQGTPENGYLCRGYRMFEELIYLCTFELLSIIPSLTNPKKNLKDEFFEFNRKVKIHAKARLVKNGKIVNGLKMELNWRDQLKLIRLLYLPEEFFDASQIDHYFSPAFLRTNFWFQWASTFAFEPSNSLTEMKRYLSRTVHCAPKFDDMTCVLSAPYNEHDFIIVPLEKWLKKKGVNFRQSCKVTKIEFAQNTSKKIVTALELDQHAVIKRTRTAPKNPRREKINVAPDDLVFFTNGSITADASIGSMEKPPLAVTKKTSSWELWESIAVKFEGFGKPSVFYGVKQKTKMESFTITFHDPLFFKLVEKLTGNKAGTGGLTTLKGSNWLMSIILPHQPYFRNQPKNVFVCWGYCLTPDATGNHVRKKMTACSGREILEELCFHLGFQKQAPEIIKNAICIPSLLPYITSQFMPRKRTDRPEVVPKGSQNFACLGQYVEIPDEIVFTVECSIRSAKIAVKKLLKLKNKIPPLHRKKYDAKSVFNAIKTMMQ